MTEPSLNLVPEYNRRRGNVPWLRFLDGMTYTSAVGGALVMVALVILLLAVVGHGALPAYKKFGLSFLTSTRWSPHPPEREDMPPPEQVFGARTAITGTLLTSIIALLISFPVSMGTAIFLTKLAPKLRIPVPSGSREHRWKWISLRHGVTVIRFMVELLAAIPSIAYGLWGVVVLAPFLQSLQPFLSGTETLRKLPAIGESLPDWHVGLNLSQWPWVGEYFLNSGYGTNVVTAGIILSIMVTPIITAIIRDVLSVTPPELEQGALGLGATWWQATRMVLGFSKMGILGAVILGFARAIGETMAVTMVIGNSGAPDNSLFSPGQTIASLLAVQFRNADTNGEIDALVYAAFVLLVITMVINGVARLLIVRVAGKAGRK